MSSVTVSGMSFAYPASESWFMRRDGTGNQVLSNMDFSIEEGEIVALLGKSGIGKSTLLKVIAGLCKPTVGSVRVFGQSAPQARTLGTIGFVPQSRHLLPWRNVEGNITFPPCRSELEPDAVKQLARLLHIDELLNSRPSRISGGQASRAALARALIRRPKLLLMDEPFSSVDPLLRETLWEEVCQLPAAQKVTSIFTTHDIGEAIAVSTDIIVLGKVGSGANIILRRRNAPKGWIEDEAQLDSASLEYELRKALSGGGSND